MAIGATTYGVASTGGNREEVLKNSLTTLEPTKTPFTSMLSKVSTSTVFTEVGGDRLTAPSISGSAEGDSGTRGGNATLKRARFGVYPQRWVKQWSVSDVQQLVSKKGGNYFTQNEADFAYAKATLELKRNIEATMLSSRDCQSSSSGDMLTRGAYKWLVASGQSPAVPSDFMPTAPASSASECLVSTANLTESKLSGVLKLLSDVDGGGSEYTMFAGNDFVEDMDFLLRTADKGDLTYDSDGSVRFSVNHADTDTEIRMIVKTFKTTFGVVHVVPAKWQRLNATSVSANGDAKSALILNMDLWDFGMLEDIHESYTWQDSGGEGGDLKCIGSLLCYSPRGNGFIINGSSITAV
jgi:hypothetical protein